MRKLVKILTLLLCFSVMAIATAHISNAASYNYDFWKNALPSAEGLSYKDTYYGKDIQYIDDSNKTLTFNTLEDMDIYNNEIFLLDSKSDTASQIELSINGGKPAKFSGVSTITILNEEMKYIQEPVFEFEITKNVFEKLREYYDVEPELADITAEQVNKQITDVKTGLKVPYIPLTTISSALEGTEDYSGASILLTNASGITVVPDDDSYVIYVADTGNSRIVKMTADYIVTEVYLTPTDEVFFQWNDEETIELGLSVIDTGMGIKQEDLSKLFDSFKRLDISKNRNIEGTGLGLNIAKRLVELMQGNITVESEYGKGSTFTVLIPQKVMGPRLLGDMMKSLQECRMEKEALVTEVFTAPNATILVVDDNAMNLSVMKELLKRTKINVDLAASGKECLELTKHKVYDMILLDHMMPELDGIETLNILRADLANRNRKTAVIALTANASAGSREMYLENGFDDYFAKPIQADKLEALLIKYLPKAFVRMEKIEKEEEVVAEKPSDTQNQEEETDLLFINRKMGISYCLESEELYQQILSSFCKQALKYLPQLDEHFKNRDWKQYAIIAHGLKGNALNIGAENFSKLSLQHERAAKEENTDFITAEYEKYITTLKSLVDKIEKMI